MSPLKTSSPAADSLWIATLWGTAGVLVVELDPERRTGRRGEGGLLVGDVQRAHLRCVGPAPPLGAGAGVALASAIAPASQASNSAGVERLDLEQHDPMAGPAQLGALAPERLTGIRRVHLEVELVHPARNDVALEQELRDVEGVDDVQAGQR